ncbi:MAG: Mrp/NBP35 family ATP-binding protein [Rikenellaceae bacterium]
MTKELSSGAVLEALSTIIHPESGESIVKMGLVGAIKIEGEKLSFTIRMVKAHDPLGGSLRRAAVSIIETRFGLTPSIVISDPKPVNAKEVAREKMREQSNLRGVRRVVAISSGKGGVGKSSVTANTAIALAQKGYRVGVLDADIYGPSMPTMFGSKGYMPTTSDDATEGEQASIEPALCYGVRVMSIGYFIKDTDALVWRGPMATSALRQLIHQTSWGELDFLLIDLPPGTSDVHLTLVSEIKIDAAVIVTTPQLVALADVVRGIEMFRTEHINIPVLGIVENMAWFEPELGSERYYIFGRGKIEAVSSACSLGVIASIPIIESLASSCDAGEPLALSCGELFEGVVSSIEEIA